MKDLRPMLRTVRGWIASLAAPSPRTPRWGALTLPAALAALAVLGPGAGLALAQSPFAGTWHGKISATIRATCTYAGTSSTATCTYSAPWSATVDGNGLLSGVEGPGSEVCEGVSIPDIDNTTYPFQFRVPSDGYVPDVWDGAQLGCALPARFVASPSLSMSGSVSNCSFYESDPATGVVCQGTILQASVSGTGQGLAFPMTVTANIGPTVSSASASIQFRPQDVGSSGSVYTFAVAPQTITKAADGGEPAFTVGYAKSAGGRKATPVACVLAQLNSSGQLQAVSASSLQAYLSGVLSSQGASVTILGNVSTANITGATFFVGYGSSSSAMISGNVVNRAVTVPGALQCNPQPPQTGWWWNPSEGGRGFSIEYANSNLFMATYLYDVSGRATWYVAAGPTAIDGSLFSGQLLAFGNGVTLQGTYRPNSQLPNAGAISLAFNDAQNGTLVWPGGTVALQRFPLGPSGTSATPLAGQPESGWWWGGSADNGRGFFIEWQGNQAFLAGYMYDSSGNPIWYVAQAAVSNPATFQGSWLQFANGQTLTGAYRPATLVNGNVAPVTIQFQGAGTGLITLPSGTLPITRFRF